MSEQKPTIYPTLVIGLGGAGTDVVRAVKRRFRRTWRQDEFDELPSVLQVMAVDTEPLVNGAREEPLYFHEYAFLGKFDATRLVKNKDNHKPYLDWWRWGDEDLPLGYIHNGAKQLRPIGRLAFFRKYVTFKAMLLDKLRTMRELPAIQEAEERGYPVAKDFRLIYIVSSLCGGTGSGMFLDVAHRVRQEVGSNASIVGIFLMPTVFEHDIRSDLQRSRIKANAYAALRELNYYHVKPQEFKASYPSEEGILEDTPYRALSQIFLIERVNEAGQNISAKHGVTSMVAHFIYLNAFSHLNRRILGLDVNITEERRRSARNGAGTGSEEGGYLAYSSFSTSSLVIPRDPLWRYFVHKVTDWSLYSLLGIGYAQELVLNIYRSLVDDLGKEFQRYYFSEQSLKELERSLSGKAGQWLGFASKLRDAVARVFQEYGLAAANELIYRVGLESNSDALQSYDLAHVQQRPFKRPEQKPNTSIFSNLISQFQSRQDRERREKELNENALFEKREEVWNKVLDSLRALAGDWLNQIRAAEKEIDEARNAARQSAAEIEKSLHPLRDSQDEDTSTYYDLETGAISSQQLEDYWQEVGATMSETTISDLTGDDQEAQQTPWDALVDLLKAQLMPEDTEGFRDLDEAELRLTVRQAFDPGGTLGSLRDIIMRSFDLRNIVEIQHREYPDGRRPPNHRVDQWLNRCSPFAAVDGDTHPHSEADEEHIRLATVPSTANGQDNAAFKRAQRSYTEYEWVPVPNQERVDACHILHGLPVGRLTSMPELYRQYRAFEKKILHIRPELGEQEPPTFPHPYQPPEDSNS